MTRSNNRHVIVEGPDGAGKSTLVKYLSAHLRVPVARRVSDSIKGVEGVNLARYVEGDMRRWANNGSPNRDLHSNAFHSLDPEGMGSRIYDRHPLISEPIYGLHVRKAPQPEFMTQWYQEAYARFLTLEPLVVWCIPPYDEVCKHVHPDRDMDGVWRNINQLYRAYRLAAHQYPGASVIYDHTTHKPAWVANLVSAHLGLPDNLIAPSVS